MKTSKTDSAPQTITVIPPAQILGDAIAAAIKPHASALADAVQRDRELEEKALAVHPEAIRKQALELLDKANAGDADALAALEAHNGLDGYVSAKSGMYHIFDGVRKNHASGTAPLIAALAADLVPAMQTAGRKIQEQFSATMAALGELNAGLSEHDANIRNRCNGIEAAVRQAESGIGPAWLLGQLGLLAFIE